MLALLQLIFSTVALIMGGWAVCYLIGEAVEWLRDRF